MNSTPKKEKTRYRVIRLDNHFIVLDCLEDKVYYPFLKAYEAEAFIEKNPEKHKVIMKHRSIGLSNKIGIATVSSSNFSKDKCFRAIVEAKYEYDGKPKTVKSVPVSSIWADMLKAKK